VGYVHDECNDIMVRLRLAFKRGNVELPADRSTAAFADVTLLLGSAGGGVDVDEAALLGTGMPAMSLTATELRPVDVDASFSLHQARWAAAA
jgi:hypothetical protein